jgi:formylmethanofuran dehydrogenase subunit E
MLLYRGVLMVESGKLSEFINNDQNVVVVTRLWQTFSKIHGHLSAMLHLGLEEAIKGKEI